MPRRATVDLEVVQGDSFEVDVTFVDANGTPINLTGYTFAAQTRVRPGATEFVSFTVDLTSATVGIVKLKLTSVQTASLPTGFWDLQQTNPSSEVLTIMGGRLTVLQGVTR